jgi:hypothetical protein
MGKFQVNPANNIWEYLDGKITKTVRWVIASPATAAFNGDHAIADLDVNPPADLYRMWARHEWIRAQRTRVSSTPQYRHIGPLIWSSKKAFELNILHHPIPDKEQIENCVLGLCELDRTDHFQSNRHMWACSRIINAIGYRPGVTEARRMLQDLYGKMNRERGRSYTQLYFAFLCWGMLPFCGPLNERSLAKLEPTLKKLFPADLERLLEEAVKALEPLASKPRRGRDRDG